jgi:hypothetical protein
MTRIRPVLAALGAALLLTALPAPTSAQYFGQNKVQYDDFDWKVIQTDELDFHYYAATEEVSREMARAAERWRWRLSRVFNHELSERKPVVMYANHPDFQQTNIIQGEIGIGTGGVTDPYRNRATQPYTGDFHSSAHVVGHELAHVFQFDIAAAGPGVRAMGNLPLWVIEGMAEYVSVGRVDPHTAMWMRDAVLRGDIPTVSQLSSGRYFPYRYGQAILAYIGGVYGDRAVTRLYKLGLQEGVGSAIRKVTGLTPAALSEAWATELRRTYLPSVQDRDAPEDVGRPLFPDQDRERVTDLAPVLSPNGRRIAFMSQRGLFSIDLYVADVETGEIQRRLTSAAREPHFDALNFLETAGTWSPEGRFFAYVVVDDGDNELRIADVRRERTVEHIEIPGVNALNDPTWSPDGRYIAFSASAGGISDLYVYDREQDEVTALTDDLYAQLQPSWSPDGQSLIYVTDQGPETDLRSLQFGPLRLARMELGSRRATLLPSFTGFKHIDPHFGPDGRSIYFISDRDGVSDIFRLDLRTDRFYRVTRTATGISGITAHSPALSVAPGTGRLAFSIFRGNQYTLHLLEPDEARGELVTGPGTMIPDGVLPPVAGTGAGVVGQYLAAPHLGLPPAPDYAVEDYSPGLALEYIGPPMIGASVDQFGTNIGGSVSFFFRDLLGDRSLGVLAQAQGEVQDLGGQVFYENRANRLNWGLLAGRVPYRTGRQGAQRTETGQILVRNQVFRTFLNQAGGQLAYPLSRARRLEGNAVYTYYSYDAEEERFLCDPAGSNCQQVEEVELGDLEPEPVSLFQSSAAYVGDWANFAFTGPISGGRFRFEAEPTFGDLQFTSALADYRRYIFWRPVTLAVRGLHYGRYGEDADNRRFLTPLFLGSQGLIRGYSYRSFDASECTTPQDGSDQCPEFDRLVGSRIGLTSVELRYPLLGVEEFGAINFPILPTTVGAFFDAGVAWDDEENPDLTFATETAARVPVFSAGVFTRSNVLGYVVVGMYLAHPFQRPEKDWVFGFELQPGW